MRLQVLELILCSGCGGPVLLSGLVPSASQSLLLGFATTAPCDGEPTRDANETDETDRDTHPGFGVQQCRRQPALSAETFSVVTPKRGRLAETNP